jgi:hypothetical protein
MAYCLLLQRLHCETRLRNILSFVGIGRGGFETWKMVHLQGELVIVIYRRRQRSTKA